MTAHRWLRRATGVCGLAKMQSWFAEIPLISATSPTASELEPRAHLQNAAGSGAGNHTKLT